MRAAMKNWRQICSIAHSWLWSWPLQNGSGNFVFLVNTTVSQVSFYHTLLYKLLLKKLYLSRTNIIDAFIIIMHFNNIILKLNFLFQAIRCLRVLSKAQPLMSHPCLLPLSALPQQSPRYSSSPLCLRPYRLSVWINFLWQKFLRRKRRWAVQWSSISSLPGIFWTMLPQLFFIWSK